MPILLRQVAIATLMTLAVVVPLIVTAPSTSIPPVHALFMPAYNDPIIFEQNTPPASPTPSPITAVPAGPSR
jgi:hypothetical protein